MKSFIFIACALALLCGSNALPSIVSSQDCGNGISCASSQTCMSNATGAGLLFACSPLPNAVRCNDARFSCPASFTCAEDSKCLAADGSFIDAIVNVDAFQVAEMRDFGNGMKPTAFQICGAITTYFQLPNFCQCKGASLGGELSCTIGLQNYITIGASAWLLPCASPANMGYKAWVNVLGASKSIGQTWTASFQYKMPIPYASFTIGVADVGAQAILSADISRLVLSSKIAIGVCAKVGVGYFSYQICDPSALPWLPVTVVNGPKFDFSKYC